MSLRVAALLLTGGLALAACGGDGQESSTPGDAPASSTPIADDPGISAPNAAEAVSALGAARWAAVDGVPLYRKPGLAIRKGLVYEPAIDDDRRQVSARLTIEAEQSAFTFAPTRGEAGTVDQMQLGEITGADDHTLFAIDDATGQLHTWRSDGQCVDVAVELAAVGLDIFLDERLDFDEVMCAESVDIDGFEVGSIDPPIQDVRSFGLLLTASPGDLVEFDWLALGDSSEAIDDGEATFRVETTGLEQSIARRSTSPDDDASVEVLSVIDVATGEASTVKAMRPGVFEFIARRGSILDVALTDYGLDHHVLGGPWLDTTHASTNQRIDLTPIFTPTGAPPEDSGRTREPHVLSTWSGRPQAAQQEYRGLTFSNNLGDADRDRISESPNDCRRVAYLGGSFVEAIQTRVDQKPGIVAERLLDLEADQCVEVLTVGRDTFTIENHADNVNRLVSEFGVETLIFAMSEGELCKMNDAVYELINAVSATTPLRWRLVDGEFIEPVTRRVAEAAEVPDGVEQNDLCNFGGTTPDAADEIMTKVADLAEAYEQLAPGVAVRFLNVRDGLPDVAVADELQSRCEQLDLDCDIVLPPTDIEKPAGLEDDVSPYLYRFRFDSHPTVRANQVIGRALADIILAN